MPEWILPEFERSLGEAAADTAALLQSRAPITLRVNVGKCNVNQAAADLAEIGIETQGQSCLFDSADNYFRRTQTAQQPCISWGLG